MAIVAALSGVPTWEGNIKSSEMLVFPALKCFEKRFLCVPSALYAAVSSSQRAVIRGFLASRIAPYRTCAVPGCIRVRLENLAFPLTEW